MKQPNREKKTKADITAYMRDRLGISVEQAGRYMQALAEYITISLSQDNEVLLAKLGKLIVKRGQRNTIKFRPSPTLVDYIAATQRNNFEMAILDYIQEESNNEKTKQHKINQRLVTWKRINTTFDRYPMTRYNLLPYHLLAYLQRDFPYKRDWKHPLSGEVHPWEQIKEKILIYRNMDINGYMVLYTMWICIDDRKARLARWDISNETLTYQLQKALDAILFMLCFPELEPENIKSLYG
jgi:nucleoid DNA-binding protein